MTFKDLSDELYREYVFDAENIIRIERPLKFNVSKSGGHRILDNAGISHYIPSGWIQLRWKVKAGKKPFSF